jgi:SAM-dependent methyltransferase
MRGWSVPRAEYKRLLTEAYDLDKPEPPEAELERWLRYARAAGGPVLEIMCGSGRFLVPLALAGIDIDGIDASADMLAACTAKGAARGIAPNVRQQAVEQLDLPRKYALAFVAAGSFGLLIDEADYRRALGRVYDHLVPGGRIVVDAESPQAAPRANGLWTGRWWTRADGAKIVERRVARYDETRAIEEGLGIYELYVDGTLVETELDDWIRRFWEPDALRAVLGLAGFVDVEIKVSETMLVGKARRPG